MVVVLLTSLLPLHGRLSTSCLLQVFALDQILIFEYQGVNYELKVNHLLVTDKAGDQVGATRAQLVPNTALLYQLPAGSNIRLIGDDVMQPPPKQLFKQSDINFEKLGIGGLDKQFEQIFRRAFASRVFPPEVVEKLGIHHVKGLLLYGPPGTGKPCCLKLFLAGIAVSFNCIERVPCCAVLCFAIHAVLYCVELCMFVQHS